MGRVDAEALLCLDTVVDPFEDPSLSDENKFRSFFPPRAEVADGPLVELAATDESASEASSAGTEPPRVKVMNRGRTPSRDARMRDVWLVAGEAALLLGPASAKAGVGEKPTA